MSKDNIFEIALDITLEFNDTQLKLPTFSGQYLVITMSGTIMELEYNADVQKWNYHIDQDGNEHSINVAFWAHYNTLLNELKEEAWYGHEHSNK